MNLKEWVRLPPGALIFMKYAIIIYVSVIMCSCTSTQRKWKSNLYVDTGVQLDKNNRSSSGYVGMSYWLDYGITINTGVWRTVEGYTGPYVGVNYSFKPFH